MLVFTQYPNDPNKDHLDVQVDLLPTMFSRAYLAEPVFIQASLCKIQGHFKDKTPKIFKDYKFMKNPDLSVKILLQKC